MEKVSLSHQLTAYWHIDNSKNKKMVITLLQHLLKCRVLQETFLQTHK